MQLSLAGHLFYKVAPICEDQEELWSLPSSEADKDQDDSWMDVVTASVPPWALVPTHCTPIAERLLHSVSKLHSKLAKVIAGKFLQWPVLEVYDILRKKNERELKEVVDRIVRDLRGYVKYGGL